jgi:hypothetical protein
LDTKHLNVRVGEALTGQAVGAGSSDKIILVRPDQESVELTVQTPTTADGWSWTYTDTNMQGIYRVGSATSTMQQFAANIDPVQSDMKSLEVTAIEAIASPKTIVQPESITESLPSLSNSAARIFLILLGLLLIAESSFAWLVGRQVG